MDRIIETERLTLRALVSEDAEDVFEWVSDPIVNKYMPYSLYQNVNEVVDWISSLDKTDNTFAFCLKNTSKVIGSGSITFDKNRNAYELGYNLNQKYWGKGYATEASKALIMWAYSDLGAHNFCANHANENIASGNVIKKCGFQFERYEQYSDGSATFYASFYTLHLE